MQYMPVTPGNKLGHTWSLIDTPWKIRLTCEKVFSPRCRNALYGNKSICTVASLVCTGVSWHRTLFEFRRKTGPSSIGHLSKCSFATLKKQHNRLISLKRIVPPWGCPKAQQIVLVLWQGDYLTVPLRCKAKNTCHGRLLDATMTS